MIQPHVLVVHWDTFCKIIHARIAHNDLQDVRHAILLHVFHVRVDTIILTHHVIHVQASM